MQAKSEHTFWDDFILAEISISLNSMSFTTFLLFRGPFHDFQTLYNDHIYFSD